MKLKRLLIICLTLLLIKTSAAQIAPFYSSLRTFPSDSITWNQIQKLFGEKYYDSAVELSYQSAEQSFQENNMNDYLFVLNQSSANVLVLSGNLELAKDILQKAYSSAIKNGDTLQLEFVVMLKYIAIMHFYAYEDDIANQYYKRGLSLLETMNIQNAITADFYLNTGASYLNIGQLKKALPNLKKAMEFATKFHIPSVYMLASQSYGYLASNKDVNLAIEFYLKNEKDAEQLMQLDSGTYYKYLSNICNVLSDLYYVTGNMETSNQYLEKAYQYISISTIPDAYLRLMLSNKMITLYADDKEFKNKLIAQSLENLKTAKQENTRLGFIAYVAFMRAYGKDNNAELYQLYKSKADSILENGKLNPRDIHTYFGSLAQIADSNSLEACNYNIQAIQAYFPDFDTNNVCLDTMANDNLEDREYIATVLPAMVNIGDYYTNMAKLSDDFKNYHIAENIYFASLLVMDNLANNAIERKTGLKYSEEYERTAQKLLNIYFQLNQKSGNDAYLEKCFSLFSKLQSFYFRHEMQMKATALDNSKDESYKKYVQLLLKKKYLDEKYDECLLTNKTDIGEALQDSIRNISYLILEQQFVLDENNSFDKNQNNLVSLEDVQNIVSEKEAILMFYLSETDIYSFYIDKHRKILNKSPKSINLKKDIKNIYKGIKTGQALKNISVDNVSEILLGNIHHKILNKKHLLIIPDKELYYIPFGILKNHKKRLIESSAITYQSNIGLWFDNNGNKPNNTSIKLFAPSFSAKTDKNIRDNKRGSSADFLKKYKNNRKELQDLPYSKIEVKSIQKLFQKKQLHSELFIDQEATEQAFKNSHQHEGILHIATHSFSDKKYPELSGLFFNLNPGQDDDGYLFINELYNMNLNANLVVLSSCKSGVGNIEGGEGMNSLQKKFMLAGVPNVIGSLWMIQDKKTKQLMVDFYSYLLAGNNYAEALRLAKLNCMAKGFLPMDYAGFILMGE
jgi:CHAT domain-containing protein